MPKCVLLVDDSPAVRRSLCIIFESAGIEVCGEAEDGAKAIEKAKHLKPDLIVLDLGMPVMNGLQAAPILRAMHPSFHVHPASPSGPASNIPVRL